MGSVDVVAGLTAAVSVGATSADVVAVEARKHRHGATQTYNPIGGVDGHEPRVVSLTEADSPIRSRTLPGCRRIPDRPRRSRAKDEEPARDLIAFCRFLGIPFGINVESVSIRRVEIEMAVHLAEQLGSELRR